MRLISIILLAFWSLAANAQDIAPRDGWVVMRSDKTFAELLDATTAAVADKGMAVVTQAGPTEVAASRGIDIPNNRVLGVFNNVFAVRILKLSTAAMIEAPIRIYLTEDAEGATTLSYKTPTFVLAPYVADSGDDLKAAGRELDAIFLAIAEAAR